MLNVYRVRQHPNWFTAYYLNPDGSERVHVWDGVSRRGDPHRHAWTVWSQVVLGELRVRTYHEVESPDGPLVRYHWSDDEELVEVGRGSLDLVDVFYVRAGENHECPLDLFHDVMALGPTVTLFTHGPVVQPSIVYREPSA